MSQNHQSSGFFAGLRDGVPIGLAYLSVSFGFGITAVSLGLTVLESLLISMSNLTSAGQVAGITVIAAAGGILEMILTQLVINLRYSLMGITLTQRMDAGCTTRRRLLMSFGLTDEIFALAVSKPSISSSYYYGLMVTPWLGWSTGTLLGALMGQILPDSLRSALGILIYAMFLSIMIPVAKKSRSILAVTLLAMIFSTCIAYIPLLSFITEGFSIIISSVLAAALVALVCPEQEKEGQTDAI